MKIFKKIIAIFLSSIILMTSACSCNNDTKKYPGTNEVTVNQTNIDLYSGGVSEYKIVIPQNAKTQVTFAAQEFVYFFNLATGYTLDVVEDTQITSSKNAKYFSIDNTTLLKDEKIQTDNLDLGESGFIIKTVGSTVFMTGATNELGYGSLYAVYEYLHLQFGLEVYAIDEIKIDKVSSAKLLDIDALQIPSIQKREIEANDTLSNAVFASRLRMTNRMSESWGLFGHGNYYLLHWDDYYEDHPDWYGPADRFGTRQLNFTNEEMKLEYIERVKYYIDTHPNSEYFMLGQADGEIWPNTKEIRTALAKYGNMAGLQTVFLNSVIEEVEAWRKEKYPDRKITYLTFAYNLTEAPPVVLNEKTNKYEPIHPDVVPHEKLIICLAQIDTLDFAYPLDHEANADAYKNIMGWKSLTSNVMTWVYSFYTMSRLINFNNYTAVAENYRIFAELGFPFVFDEFAHDSSLPGLQEMRTYVQSKLLWDVSKSYMDLANDFIDNYYKEAAPEMKSYLNFLINWQTYLRDEKGLGAKCFDDPDDAAYWPVGVVEQLNDLLEKALEKIESIKDVDYEKYVTLHNRIEIEQIFPLYLKLKLHKGSYLSEYTNLIDTFEVLVNRYSIYKIGAYKAIEIIEEFRGV